MRPVFWAFLPQARSQGERIVVSGVRLEESLLSDSWSSDDEGREAPGAGMPPSSLSYLGEAWRPWRDHVFCLLSSQGIPASNPFPKGMDCRLTPLAENSLLFDDKVSAGGSCEAAGAVCPPSPNPRNLRNPWLTFFFLLGFLP